MRGVASFYLYVSPSLAFLKVLSSRYEAIIYTTLTLLVRFCATMKLINIHNYTKMCKSDGCMRMAMRLVRGGEYESGLCRSKG